MKTGLICVIVLFIAMSGSSANGLERFAVYDDFHSRPIDETKWYGAYNIATGVTILETRREISLGRLHMLSRFYGNMGFDTGVSYAQNILGFAHPDTITAMKANVQVVGIEADGCPSNSTPTIARAALEGTFFNTDAPTPGSLLNDVLAVVEIRRASNSTDEPGILQVVGSVVQCKNQACSSFNLLQKKTLGCGGLKILPKYTPFLCKILSSLYLLLKSPHGSLIIGLNKIASSTKLNPHKKLMERTVLSLVWSRYLRTKSLFFDGLNQRSP